MNFVIQKTVRYNSRFKILRGLQVLLPASPSSIEFDGLRIERSNSGLNQSNFLDGQNFRPFDHDLESRIGIKL